MAIDARAVANEILIRAWEMGFEPTQLDVQKITYFLHGHHLIEHGAPLVATEFEAWQHGPIQQVLLDAFRSSGEEPIRDLATRFDPIRRTRHQFPRVQENTVLDTFDRYLEIYLSVSTFDLVDLTHQRGTPWSETINRAKFAVNIGMRISNDLIESCFEGLRVA